MSGLQPFCAAVDWGTTNFRIWLLSEHGDVLRSKRSSDGLASVAQRQFRQTLEHRLAELDAGADLPVMICGMAGSRSGWAEAPYLEAPANLGQLAGNAVRVDDPVRDIRILPGISQRNGGLPDVMRGEETQLLGARVDGLADGLFCIPGTHSKWVTVKAGTVLRFSTYMTGEMYELLRKHSVLAQFAAGATGPVDKVPAFGEAARAVIEDAHQAVARMFSIRAAGLLANEGDVAAARLSGLLIGAEVGAALAGLSGRKVHLAASGGLAAAYLRVLEIAGVTANLLDPEVLAVKGIFEAARQVWPQDTARSVVA